jgi:pyruvate dehydrogenase (quinone)
VLFADVADFCHTITSAAQMPRMLEQAIQAAYAGPGVAVLTLPGDVGSLDAEKGTSAHINIRRPVLTPHEEELTRAATLINAASRVTMLVGMGARDARAEVLAIAEHLQAPMVLTLKGKEELEHDNPYQIGQSGLIGNPATKEAFDDSDVLLMVGTDFPYPQWLPAGTPTVQIDVRPEHIGRRIPVDVGIVGDSGPSLQALLARLDVKSDESHLKKARDAYESWSERQQRLVNPDHDKSLVGKIRSKFDNTDDRIRPEVLAAVVNDLAADDAIFTTDTGMSTVWLSRFVTLRGSRRLLGSYNLGSMANAMPQALGAQAIDRSRQVIAFCGDGGLTMLLGDLLTAVAYELPIKLVVFDNGRLGMVKLEQEQGGLPEFGTTLHNPDLAAVARAMGLGGIRVTDPEQLAGAVAQALATPGPVLIDVLTNPEEISLPPKTTAGDAWGFAIAKMKETLTSPGDKG